MEKVSLTAGAVCNGCLVYEQQDQNVVVLIDTPSWYAWLETATTFTCDEGVFTAHKAPAGNRRGGWYWRAYRRRRGRLSRCYLGVSTNLTLANLRGAARRLAGDAEDMESLQADEGTPPPVPVPLASGELTSTVILQSTTTPPRLPVQHVARPRLLALLEQGLRGPVTLVSAPAGSGKTTLLAEWAATSARPIAWLSCEEGENDPARFLSSLIAALARVDARLDIAAHWHPDEHERVLTRLLNDLERVFRHDTVLILDDVHALTTEASPTTCAMSYVQGIGRKAPGHAVNWRNQFEGEGIGEELRRSIAWRMERASEAISSSGMASTPFEESRAAYCCCS
jgi:LuxR family transcriptional regulator, maltose regulon positive regulatory protein